MIWLLSFSHGLSRLQWERSPKWNVFRVKNPLSLLLFIASRIFSALSSLSDTIEFLVGFWFGLSQKNIHVMPQQKNEWLPGGCFVCCRIIDESIYRSRRRIIATREAFSHWENVDWRTFSTQMSKQQRKIYVATSLTSCSASISIQYRKMVNKATNIPFCDATFHIQINWSFIQWAILLFERPY